MYVQSINENNYNISMQKAPKKPNGWHRFASKIKQKIIDTLPQKDFTSDPKKIDKRNKLDSRISRPMENRLIMGATAILTQPTIDYYNHRVDEDTRIVSRNRTIAKIIAGTTVGVVVRGLCFKLVEKMTDINGTKKFSKSLIPENYMEEFTKFLKKLSNHRNALSTGIAILVMCFTNFALDAPLTAILTNKFNAKSKEKDTKKGKEVTYV